MMDSHQTRTILAVAQRLRQIAEFTDLAFNVERFRKEVGALSDKLRDAMLQNRHSDDLVITDPLSYLASSEPVTIVKRPRSSKKRRAK